MSTPTRSTGMTPFSPDSGTLKAHHLLVTGASPKMRQCTATQALPVSASGVSATVKLTALPGTMVEIACLYTIWVTVLRSNTTY